MIENLWWWVIPLFWTSSVLMIIAIVFLCIVMSYLNHNDISSRTDNILLGIFIALLSPMCATIAIIIVNILVLIFRYIWNI